MHLRHGVAFSFQKSNAFRDINDLFCKLLPWVRGFDKFFEQPSRDYPNLRLWCWFAHADEREERPAGAIPEEWIQEEAFVFLGSRQPLNDEMPNLDRIGDDLDRLFKLYRYAARHRP